MNKEVLESGNLNNFIIDFHGIQKKFLELK